MESDDRRDPREYTLSEKQLAYLVDEDIGTRKESKVEEEVKEVVGNLNDRLQYLIEDIAFFHMNGYLDSSDDGSPTVSELGDLERRDGLYDSPFLFTNISQEELDYIQLPIHLGHVLHFLYTDTAEEFDKIMAAMGVLIGLNGDWLKEKSEENSSTETALKTLPDEDESIESFTMPDEETIQTLESVLEDLEESLDTTPATRPALQGLQEEIEQTSRTATKPLANKAAKKIKNSKYPYDYARDQVIDELESDAELAAVERLSATAVNDIEKLKTSKYRKATAIKVFYALYKEGEYGHPGDIAERADTKQHQVKKFLNDFSGRQQPWSRRSLAIEETTGYTPSTYGTFLGQLLDNDQNGQKNSKDEYSIPSQKEITAICHNYLFGEESEEQQKLIQTVIEEVVNTSSCTEQIEDT